MLISPKLLNNLYGIRPAGVLHVEAHDGEEQKHYDRFSWGPVLWIEALPNKVHNLRQHLRPPHTVIEACVWDTNAVEMILNVTNNSQATSLLRLGTAEESYPEILIVEEIHIRTK